MFTFILFCLPLKSQKTAEILFVREIPSKLYITLDLENSNNHFYAN